MKTELGSFHRESKAGTLSPSTWQLSVNSQHSWAWPRVISRPWRPWADTTSKPPPFHAGMPRGMADVRKPLLTTSRPGKAARPVVSTVPSISCMASRRTNFTASLADSGNIWQRLYNGLLIRNTGQGGCLQGTKTSKPHIHHSPVTSADDPVRARSPLTPVRPSW